MKENGECVIGWGLLYVGTEHCLAYIKLISPFLDEGLCNKVKLLGLAGLKGDPPPKY